MELSWSQIYDKLFRHSKEPLSEEVKKELNISPDYDYIELSVVLSALKDGFGQGLEDSIKNSASKEYPFKNRPYYKQGYDLGWQAVKLFELDKEQ